MAKKHPGKDPKKGETISTKEETKVEMVNLIISGRETAESLSKMTGCAKQTINRWVQEVAPGFSTLDKIEELDVDVIRERADKLQAATQIVLIKRALELIPDETDLGNLAKLLKEIKKYNTPEGGEPGRQTFFTQYVQQQINQYNNGE